MRSKTCGRARCSSCVSFRIAPQFETAAPNYDRIDRVIAVGIGHRRADGWVYSVFDARPD